MGVFELTWSLLGIKVSPLVCIFKENKSIQICLALSMKSPHLSLEKITDCFVKRKQVSLTLSRIVAYSR